MQVNYQSGMQTSASALAAYRRWMDTIAQNLANAQTTRTAAGGPYRRQQVTFEQVAGAQASARPGVSALAPARTSGAHLSALQGAAGAPSAPTVRAVVSTDTETSLTRIYDPGHPHADAEGWVAYPNVDAVTEMVNLVLASRAYEANVAALASEQRLQELSLSIGKP